MGATKYETYTEKQIQFANFFKALAHPARYAVVEKLIEANGQDLDFEEVFDGIDLAQSTKSEHLKQLVNSGILKTKLITKDRRSCLRYRLNKPAIEFLEKFIHKINELVDLNDNERISFLQGFYQNNINFYRLNLF
ncbi:MAG: ArsR family transcriptional regulator [Crocinitomicaceae bacterium]|nr:ArsR family transcriptional regulator [Crocinitomicaceae bacterium]